MFKQLNEVIEKEMTPKQVNKLAAIGWAAIGLATAGVIFGSMKIVETLRK